MPDWLNKWRQVRDAAADVLSMNRRNLGYVYPHNARCDFPVANDKLLCKEILQPLGVPLAKTHYSYRYFYELRTLAEDLKGLDEFVIKPASGSAGNGIIVIVGREGDEWLGISGKRYSLEAIQRHLSDIIFGVFSFDNNDAAIIEERVVQHEVMERLYDRGLADVRIILFKHEPVLAMSRVPTHASDGKANLHQGAVGLGIALESGRCTHAMLQGVPIEKHPDSGTVLIGVEMPFWSEILSHSRHIAEAVPLKYLGIDIAIGKSGPVLLEINARPGLEIQNVNRQAMRPLLEAIR
ncbi:MAG: alpha-L-glutamate ligase-like protein [Chromatiales bacterium]|nr:alpha-L-glutamate ligase-like protein [Chromatiales bacterium]